MSTRMQLRVLMIIFMLPLIPTVKTLRQFTRADQSIAGATSHLSTFLDGLLTTKGIQPWMITAAFQVRTSLGWCELPCSAGVQQNLLCNSIWHLDAQGAAILDEQVCQGRLRATGFIGKQHIAWSQPLAPTGLAPDHWRVLNLCMYDMWCCQLKKCSGQLADTLGSASLSCADGSAGSYLPFFTNSISISEACLHC